MGNLNIIKNEYLILTLQNHDMIMRDAIVECSGNFFPWRSVHLNRRQPYRQLKAGANHAFAYSHRNGGCDCDEDKTEYCDRDCDEDKQNNEVRDHQANYLLRCSR